MKEIIAIESTSEVFLKNDGYNRIEFFERDVKTGDEIYLGHCSGYFPDEVKEKILETYKEQ